MPTSNRRDFLVTAGKGALAAGLTAAVGGQVQAQQPPDANEPLAPPDKQPPDLNLPPGAPPKKLGYAIVGLGELALGEILPAFNKSMHCHPVALVSGHPDKAERIADFYGIDHKSIYSYDNYDTIRDNPAVDVIYIVLPNHMHAEFTVRGFKAGKHVLCEKPMAVTPAECQQMIDAGKAANKKLMIAYRLHYEPFNTKAIELGQRKPFGPIKFISAENLQDVKAPNIRLSTSTGGGPLGDVGIYCLNATRYLTGEEPIEVCGATNGKPADDPRFREVPARVQFTLRFPSGVIAQCGCGFDTGISSRYRVTCEKGYYELDVAFAYTGQNLYTGDGEERQRLTSLKAVDHFAAEMDAFADAIVNDGTIPTAGEEGLKDVQIMCAIQHAIREGRPVKLDPSQPFNAGSISG